MVACRMSCYAVKQRRLIRAGVDMTCRAMSRIEEVRTRVAKIEKGSAQRRSSPHNNEGAAQGDIWFHRSAPVDDGIAL